MNQTQPATLVYSLRMDNGIAEQSHAHPQGAINEAYEYYKMIGCRYSGVTFKCDLICIDCLNVETGEVSTHMNRNQLMALMYHFEKADADEEAAEERYGSFSDQHRLRAFEVVS